MIGIVTKQCSIICSDRRRSCNSVLCDRLLGRITGLVRPSVCPSVPYWLRTGKQKKAYKKTKINVNVRRIRGVTGVIKDQGKC